MTEIDVSLLTPREMQASDSIIGLDASEQTVRVTIDTRDQSYDSLTSSKTVLSVKTQDMSGAAIGSKSFTFFITGTVS